MLEASAEDYDWTLWIELWTRALRDEETAAARRRLDERWRSDLAAVITVAERLLECSLPEPGEDAARRDAAATAGGGSG